MKNRTLYSILFFMFLLCQVGCTPFPVCSPDSSCMIVSNQKPIFIPFILPLTSQNPLQIEEQKKAIELAFTLVLQENKTYSLAFYDNYDLDIKNKKQVAAFLEEPHIPVVLSILSTNIPENKSDNPVDQPNPSSGNPLSYYYAFPGNIFYINQALDSLIPKIPIGKTIFLTSYQLFENLQMTDFCSQISDNCFPFDLLFVDEYVMDKINNAQVIILASNQIDIEEWQQQIVLLPQQKLIKFNTEFSQPIFPAEYDEAEEIYWLFPELWFSDPFKVNSEDHQQNWQYASSYWTYQISQEVFRVLLNNTRFEKSGFRQIKTSRLRDDFSQQIKLREGAFKLYQFIDSQYIMKINLQ